MKTNLRLQNAKTTIHFLTNNECKQRIFFHWWNDIGFFSISHIFFVTTKFLLAAFTGINPDSSPDVSLKSGRKYGNPKTISNPPLSRPFRGYTELKLMHCLQFDIPLLQQQKVDDTPLLLTLLYIPRCAQAGRKQFEPPLLGRNCHGPL
ncbi:hypothetical protein AVEN_199134-1 [Araneus ventricosus]|uniref:Uncharacterized protein n=1 Tax=Araneus ventricosus TaxID=182803 RepID=A0A4Y2W8K5_ARAVE|nr:hypothetical protein AVEN_199134-1 [Araneus ventricosus]